MDVITLVGCRGALVSACDTVELSSNQKYRARNLIKGRALLYCVLK